MNYFRFRFVCQLLVFICFSSPTFSQYIVDSLLSEVPESKSKSKAEIYNILAEVTIEDSIEICSIYAYKALETARAEENENQLGLAWFNIAEVFSYQYQRDSAIPYYNLALDIFKKTNDNYNASYTLNNLGWLANSYGHFQEAVMYYTESLDFIDKNKHADDLSHVYLNIGNSYYQLGKYQTSIKYYRRSIAIAQAIKYEPILTYAYNGIAISNKYLSNYDSAIYYYKQALEIDKKSENELGIAIDYHNIGSLYFQWQLFDQALEYFNEAKDIYTRVGSQNDLSLILNNIGTVYREKGNYELALEFFNQALTIDSTTGIEINMASRYNNIGQLYAEQNKYRKALSYYEKSLQLNRKLGHRHNKVVNLHNIGKVYVQYKRYAVAQNYFEMGLLLADSLQATSTVIQKLSSLTDVSKIRGNYEEALDYHVQYSNLKDSTFKEKNQMAMADLKTRFDVDKKDQEINLLNNKNEYQKLEVKAYRTKFIFLVIGIVLISFLFFFLVVQYLHKNKAYKKLVDRSREIAKNKKQFKRLLNKAESKNAQVQNGFNAEEHHPELLQNLLSYFEDKKAYLNQDISIKDTVDHLSTNPKYISQTINANFNKNFNAFVIEYRIKLAMKYLANGVKKQYSIKGISEKVGFHSKSAFNASFKKITGVTPSFYIKSIKEEFPS